MIMSNSCSKWLSSLIFLVVLISSISSSCSSTTTRSLANAVVPESKTFKWINQGELDDKVLEYGKGCRILGITNRFFALVFYRIRPDAYMLAVGMVVRNYEMFYLDSYRWVWTANTGRPVHENAILSFGRDGNLVLKDADGRVAWETGTPNKGVVDIELLSNGNLVLLDKYGAFVWQSFNHPTDSLLVGQSLSSGGKLVSRLSESDDSMGHYSMVLEKRRLGFYYNRNNKNKQNKPLLYYAIPLLVRPVDDVPLKDRRVKNLTFTHISLPKKFLPKTDLLQLEFVDNISGRGSAIRAQQVFNSSHSILRLGLDGDLRVYTAEETVASPLDVVGVPWKITYNSTIQCQLPEKCGSFGLCQDNLCVACPTPKGLKNPWSKDCKPPKLPSCGNTNSGAAGTSKASNPMSSYYKMEGVVHFSSRYAKGEGPMKVGECKKKCSKDCNCVAFFYRKDTSMCLLTTQLNTLTKTNKSSHLAFIKFVPDH